MGGNALSHTSVRLTARNYERMAQECVLKLKTLYPYGRVEAIESYRSKPDHGDLDLLISADGYDPHHASVALGAIEVVRNGPVTSMGVVVRPEISELNGNVFQVDLIKSSPEEFDYSSRYFKWNDLGNLIGRVAHAGFASHRHDGLYFYFRDGDYKFREILLTRDYDKALAYLGFDANRFNEGFDTLEEIFEYVASSEFFNRDIYLLENRNAQSRIRDRKRPTYNKFLAWCEARPNLPAFAFPENKEVWLSRMRWFFPEFEGMYDSAASDLAELRRVKEKFNGEWVADITGLAGKELGALMKRFRESFESAEAQRAYVLCSEPDEIKARVLQMLASSKI